MHYTLFLTVLTLGNSKVIELPFANIEQQYAFFWLIPWWVIAAIAAAVIVAEVIFTGKTGPENFPDLKIVKVAILGPNEAGKTTLWNFFKGRPTSQTYHETEGKEHVSFEAFNKTWSTSVASNTNEKIHFTGYDINGNGDFMRKEWTELIKDSNMIIFIFNSFKYLDSIDYQRDINQRLQFVKSVIEKQTDKNKKGIWMLASYADKLKNRKEDWTKIREIINSKPYRDLLQNSACLNLTDLKELNAFYDRIFENKKE